MWSRARLISIGILLGGALFITSLGACAQWAEVAPSDKPITINLNVKIDHEIRMKVEKAKAKGLIGERTDGYLGAVNTAHAETKALIADVNRKRREAYEDVAKRNRTPLSSVELLAGEKAIQNTKRGQFIEGPDGWVKK